jgi:FtsP/CotA-like multicopper oxidase with cupredoxin domain
MSMTAVLLAGVAAAYVVYGHGTSSHTSTLPSYCSKPAGAFLIVASSHGYNDSADRLNFTDSGGVTSPWPLVAAQLGSNVTIVVCNTDVQAHGFQVQHYYDGEIHTIAPGRTMTVSFVANEPGSFRIYCSIPCTIHWAMQDGELSVS